MDGFTVWYLLSVVYLDPQSGLDNVVLVEQDLRSCQQAAARVIASQPQGSVKWLCHEMTVETKGQIVYIKLPNY